MKQLLHGGRGRVSLAATMADGMSEPLPEPGSARKAPRSSPRLRAQEAAHGQAGVTLDAFGHAHQDSLECSQRLRHFENLGRHGDHDACAALDGLTRLLSKVNCGQRNAGR